MTKRRAINVPKALKRMLQRRNMTQADLARAMRKKDEEVSVWASGGRTPSAENLVAIAGALGCSVDDVLFG